MKNRNIGKILTLTALSLSLGAQKSFAVFAHEGAEALLRKTLIEKALHLPGPMPKGNMGLNNEEAALDLAIKQPIFSITVDDIGIGKFSDEQTSRWADYTAKVLIKTTKGVSIQCSAHANIEQGQVLKKWHLNTAHLEECSLIK